jgi:alkanesulfonate monooxygenase SsuD/methylene tetrahydromethanopterin reductase-like flavin-dependent oxidoreductase (luciferase family)
VKFGINGPYMSGTNRERLLEWFRRVDEGPFDTICTGERVLWPQVEEHAFLAAAAAVTTRVRVMSNIMIVPMHAPVLLAKRIASIDVISGGRFVLGIGVGGRDDDYRAAGATMENRWQRVDDAVAVMRRVWRGQPPWEGAAAPMGPPPVQVGGPPLYSSASGPNALRRAAKWADGWLGANMTVEVDAMKAEVRAHVDAWEHAGRAEPPYLVNSLWYSLGDNAQERLSEGAARYVGLPPGSPSPFGDLPVHSTDGVKMAVDHCHEAGFDELVFIPLTDDLGELDRLEAALDGLRDKPTDALRPSPY